MTVRRDPDASRQSDLTATKLSSADCDAAGGCPAAESISSTSSASRSSCPTKAPTGGVNRNSPVDEVHTVDRELQGRAASAWTTSRSKATDARRGASRPPRQLDEPPGGQAVSRALDAATTCRRHGHDQRSPAGREPPAVELTNASLTVNTAALPDGKHTRPSASTTRRATPSCDARQPSTTTSAVSTSSTSRTYPGARPDMQPPPEHRHARRSPSRRTRAAPTTTTAAASGAQRNQCRTPRLSVIA